MLRCLLLTVGSLPKGPFEEIAHEYKKYLSRYAKLEHRVVKSSDGLLQRLPDDAFLVILDAGGKLLTSESFAEHVRHFEDAGRTIVFVIGGAEGLSVEIKQRADLLLSLSKMTTTHDLAQLFFLEQLFRALAIVHGSDYHKQYVARFQNRYLAGQELARALTNYRGRDVVVLALPRGGVPVAREVAQALNVPLDILVARKIGHPYSAEYAIGAVTENGTVILSSEAQAMPKTWLSIKIEEERLEADRRRLAYNPERLSIRQKIVIIVDDGLATGLTMQAAIEDARKLGASRVVIAVPAAPVSTAVELLRKADDLICPHLVDGWFSGVASYYDDFPQLTDKQVIAAF